MNRTLVSIAAGSVLGFWITARPVGSIAATLVVSAVMAATCRVLLLLVDDLR